MRTIAMLTFALVAAVSSAQTTLKVIPPPPDVAASPLIRDFAIPLNFAQVFSALWACLSSNAASPTASSGLLASCRKGDHTQGIGQAQRAEQT